METAGRVTYSRSGQKTGERANSQQWETAMKKILSVVARNSGPKWFAMGVSSVAAITFVGYHAVITPAANVATTYGFPDMAGSQITDLSGASMSIEGNSGTARSTTALGATDGQASVAGSATTRSAPLPMRMTDLTKQSDNVFGESAMFSRGAADNEFRGTRPSLGFGHNAPSPMTHRSGSVPAGARGAVASAGSAAPPMKSAGSGGGSAMVNRAAIGATSAGDTSGAFHTSANNRAETALGSPNPGRDTTGDAVADPIFQPVPDHGPVAAAPNEPRDNAALVDDAGPGGAIGQLDNFSHRGTDSDLAADSIAGQLLALPFESSLSGDPLSGVATSSQDLKVPTTLDRVVDGSHVPDTGNPLLLLSAGVAALFAFGPRSFRPGKIAGA